MRSPPRDGGRPMIVARWGVSPGHSSRIINFFRRQARDLAD
jgi:hypothetical protein